MRNTLLLLVGALLCTGCCTIKHIPIEKTEIHVKDSIAWHDSTIYHHIYKEHYKEYTGPLDTLTLETTYSKFKAWNDTTENLLKGEAYNKKDSIPEKIKWKEKIVYKDSIITKETQVPVEVIKKEKYIPGFYKFTLAWFILSIAVIMLAIYSKFAGK